jgi:hypothetical protein
VPEFLLEWVSSAPIPVIGMFLLISMIAAAAVGGWVKFRHAVPEGTRDDKDTYIVSSVLGLLALLMAFTFSLAIDRFETRRALVVEDANAIGTAYLRVQLLEEPHRTRLSHLLTAYTDNMITMAKLPQPVPRALLDQDDQLLADIWSATVAAFNTPQTMPFVNTLQQAINAVIDLDSSRRAARQARVPAEVFGVLLVYLVGTSCVLGNVLGFGRARLAPAFLVLLLSLSFLLIIDIDRATAGGITESQGPMEALSKSMHAQPPGTFDHWRIPAR